MIWYFDKGKPFKINFSREETSGDAYLYLPGPSLAEVDFDVRLPGCASFAVNTAYPKVRPDYWIGMDKPQCYDSGLFYEAFPKFVRGTYARKTYNGLNLFKYPNTYFADIAKPERGIEAMFQIKGEGALLVWFSHTLAVALHLILLMGYKKIHFVGCDLGGNKDYYDDRVLAVDKRDYNRRLYSQQDIFLREFCTIGKRYGVECISCTEHSPINAYMKYVPLKQAIEESRKVVVKHDIKHAVDVTTEENVSALDSIAWREPTRERGVMVMSDKGSEWMLDYWYYNYKKYNDWPILFIDAGMSEGAVQFCKARGSYIKLPPIELKGWFLKPLAMKMTTFRKTIYMDLDVEVRGSIYDLFGFEGFSISKDIHNNFSTVRDPVNSGVIVYDNGEEIIDRWCRKTVEEHHKYRGDQDILDHVEKKYTEIPHEIHWLRIMGANKHAMLYHHTGPIGKKEIRDAMVGL